MGKVGKGGEKVGSTRIRKWFHGRVLGGKERKDFPSIGFGQICSPTMNQLQRQGGAFGA